MINVYDEYAQIITKEFPDCTHASRIIDFMVQNGLIDPYYMKMVVVKKYFSSRLGKNNGNITASILDASAAFDVKERFVKRLVYEKKHIKV